MRRLLATLGLAGLLVVLGTSAAAADPSATSAPAPESSTARVSHVEALPVTADRATVILYGDSLAWEAQDHFREALLRAGVAHVLVNTFGGTAICDWLDRMTTDAAALRPTAVVVEFSGNALTPCMSDLIGRSLAASPTVYHEKYATDAEAVVRIFSAVGTRVYFAGAPKSREAEVTNDTNAGWLNRQYAKISLATGNRYVDAGAVVLDHGHFTDALPCLVSEPCAGAATSSEGRAENVVRAPDGGHFCPGAHAAVRGVTEACPVWSSGAYRFGRAMAAPVIRDLRAVLNG
jgi:hypothetical protein